MFWFAAAIPAEKNLAMDKKRIRAHVQLPHVAESNR